MATQNQDEQNSQDQDHLGTNKKIEIVVYFVIAIWIIVLAALAYFTLIG
ncbi:MAG: hypothetical protein HQM13_00930 [SAR324 cluster bacterium]|nr:hypothetical protein [SAR324 cluster bacterium]